MECPLYTGAVLGAGVLRRVSFITGLEKAGDSNLPPGKGSGRNFMDWKEIANT